MVAVVVDVVEEDVVVVVVDAATVVVTAVAHLLFLRHRLLLRMSLKFLLRFDNTFH